MKNSIKLQSINAYPLFCSIQKDSIYYLSASFHSLHYLKLRQFFFPSNKKKWWWIKHKKTPKKTRYQFSLVKRRTLGFFLRKKFYWVEIFWGWKFWFSYPTIKWALFTNAIKRLVFMGKKSNHSNFFSIIRLQFDTRYQLVTLPLKTGWFDHIFVIRVVAFTEIDWRIHTIVCATGLKRR